MLVAVLSDTHGFLDERALPYLANVDLILHAGDVGSAEVLAALAGLAPVHAVEGNNDVALDLGLPERLVMDLEGHRVQVVHQLPHATPGSAVVIHGHSHKVLNEWRGETLYLNPGAAGRRGFHSVQSMALVRLEEGKPPEAEVITLGPRVATAATRRRSTR